MSNTEYIKIENIFDKIEKKECKELQLRNCVIHIVDWTLMIHWNNWEMGELWEWWEFNIDEFNDVVEKFYWENF